MPKDKLRLLLMVSLSITLLATIAAYGYMSIILNKVNIGSSVVIILPLLVILFMAFFITRKYKDVKRGMPLEDEYSKKVMLKASSVSYYLTLYWLLFIGWFEEPIANLVGLQNLDAGQTTGLGIAGMAVFFFFFWFYYSKKPNLA